MSDQLLQKIIKIFLYVLMGVSAVFIVFFYFGGVVEGTAGTEYEQPVVTEAFIIWAYILAGLALLFTILFPLIRMILNPQHAKKTGIGIVVVALVVFVSYQLASDEPLQLAAESEWNTPEVVQWAGAGLGTLYTLLALAFLSILYTELVRFFK